MIRWIRYCNISRTITKVVHNLFARSFVHSMVEMVTLLYYKLTFKPGNEDVTLRTIKNFKTVADINTVINRNLLYKDSSSSNCVIIYDEKSGKLIHDTDIIADGCRYFIIIRRSGRQSRMNRSSSLRSHYKRLKKYNKRYWIR